MRVSRHKTAISRNNFSRPVQVALASNLIPKSSSFFDYGCGKGDDIRALKSIGHEASGWDPTHNSKERLKKADIVNLGYVVNVIEDQEERIDVIRKAYDLANKALIVSSRLIFEIRNNVGRPFKDGFITQKKTFQKYYTQDELKSFIDTALDVNSVPGAPGVFFIFKDEALKIKFETARFRRRPDFKFRLNADEIFEQNKTILKPIVDFLLARGRLPQEFEIPDAEDLTKCFGNIRRAFNIIRHVVNEDDWIKVETQRSEDLLIYLGLSKFTGRPKKTDLAQDIQLDVKAFFGSYAAACQKADELLFSAGNLELIHQACLKAPCGKRTHDAMYIHESALVNLSPILRIYEGCARSYIGNVEGANIIKLHRLKPKVSYLSYPDFDRKAHPGLRGALVVPLKSFDVKFYDYSKSDNPPILHRKEEFVPSTYPHKVKFEKLTKQEERWGLYENPKIIGTRERWNEVLQTKGVQLRGHKLARIQ